MIEEKENPSKNEAQELFSPPPASWIGAAYLLRLQGREREIPAFALLWVEAQGGWVNALSEAMTTEREAPSTEGPDLPALPGLLRPNDDAVRVIARLRHFYTPGEISALLNEHLQRRYKGRWSALRVRDKIKRLDALKAL